MAYETIIYEKADRIARITLNRPEKLNALSVELRAELLDAINKSSFDKDVSVVILKAAGRAFSAGYDINLPPMAASKEDYMSGKLGSIRDDIDNMMATIITPWTAIWNCRKPVIAQVHGYCLAGGTDLALHTDIVVCAEDAQFGFPAVRSMGTAPTHMWTYLVGPQWAKYMLFTGNSVDGKMAEKIGLVWKAVPKDNLEEEVNRLAETIAKVPYGLLAVHKRIVNVTLEMMGRGLVQQLATEGDAIGHLDPMVLEFGEIVRTKGIKAALEWRDSKFADYRTSAEAKKAREEREKSGQK